MAHPSWGGVPTASEGCADATLPRPGTAGPAPARAEGASPAAAAQLPTESSPGTPPGGRGPGKPGEGAVESWVPWVLPPPPPSPPLPSPPLPFPALPTLSPSPAPGSCRVSCSPAGPFLPGHRPEPLGPRWSWRCPDPAPSGANPSGCDAAPAAARPRRRSYWRGQVSAGAPPSPLTGGAGRVPP